LSQSKPSPSAQPTSVPLDTPKDLEAEKRSQRAARFGIPIVEQPKPHPVSVAPNGAPATSKPPTSAKSVPDVCFRSHFSILPFLKPFQDPEKLKARAARFGIQHVVEASMGQKRPAIPEHVDAEEAERRKKRAERFGLNSVVGLVLTRIFLKY
jgi:SAP domain-containing ribonucleoprotein